MKLTQFRIRRYRVFDSEISIPLSNFTVLTGPNNLGKSTVLRAIDLFFNELGARQRPYYQSRSFERSDRYSPENDYPKLYEGRPGRRYWTRFGATVELSTSDQSSAQESVSLSLPSNVDITLEVHREDERLLRTVALSGFQDDAEINLFLAWFASNFRYLYIPANRNVADFRRSVFSEIVSSTIQKVRRGRQRVSELTNLYADVQRSLEQVQVDLAADLHSYLPELKEVKFILDEPEILNFISLADVQIDDGANTSITQKGDGVKSLFVMSVLQFLAKQNYRRNLVFAIEEPEAHLHSSAIYDTKASLRSLADSFQILISTHSPILVQRDNIPANIIIDRKQGSEFTCTAIPARSLPQIRQSLGIRPHENLATAEVTIVVEGITEERSLGRLISAVRPRLSDAINDGRVRVISAGGASKVTSVLRALSRDAASCLAVFDSDEAGIMAFDEVRRSGLLNILDIFKVPPRDGCSETEFEDIFPPEIYIAAVAEACGCVFALDHFNNARTQSGDARTRMKKWSIVVGSLLQTCGKDWNDFKNSAKEAFASALLRDISSSSAVCDVWLRSIAERVFQNLRER